MGVFLLRPLRVNTVALSLFEIAVICWAYPALSLKDGNHISSLPTAGCCFLAPWPIQKSGRLGPVGMTRKVVYGYRYDPVKRLKKGTIRSKIHFDMWKDKDPYYVIHKFLYENDPDNKNFKYDIDLATKPKCTRNIFAHYKKDNKLRFFWYASGKKNVKGPYSRYINFAIEKNEFRFSKLKSFYHILPYVHEHYKEDPRYIYFMNRFLSRHGRVAEAKREFLKNAPPDSQEQFVYKRTITWKEMDKLRREQEEALFSQYKDKPPIFVDLGEGRKFKVKPDGFSVHGEYYSRIDKKLRETPYDIYHPYYRTKDSSKRRRFRERGRPLNPEDRCKSRRERLRKNALKRREENPNGNLHRKQLIKQKRSFFRQAEPVAVTA